MKSFKIFTICEICPADHSKEEKIGVTKAVSSLFENYFVFSAAIKFGLMNFVYYRRKEGYK